jgi:hypothetical protein
MQEPELRPTATAFILPTMRLKNAGLLAFVGTMVMTVLLVWNFVSTALMFSVAWKLQCCSSRHSFMRLAASL